MNKKILYTDGLIELTDDSILFRNYYYPFGSRRVTLSEVDTVRVKKPTISTGKYRYYGTGDFRTWFPPDSRSSRDKIFIMTLKNKWWRIGFTVEDSQSVVKTLSTLCHLIDNTDSP